MYVQVDRQSEHSNERLDEDSLRILVVDDSKTIRRSAENLLAQEGCTVFCANDGFEALARVVDVDPQIIFVDIMMPRLDGYQTCALIKNSPRYSSVPVIMLSSKDSIFDKARGRLVGADDYLTKPFSRDDLISAIRRLTPTWRTKVAVDE